MQPPPPVTRALMIAVFVMFFLGQLRWLPLPTWLALQPIASGIFWPWQVITYAFTHRGVDALFNILALWMFGGDLEQLWGSRRYIQFLLASTLAPAAIYLLVSLVIFGPALAGATGAVFGLLLAFGLLFPHRQILFFMVLPMEMRTAVIVYGVIELVFMLQDGAVAATNLAHLGGMLGGYLVILWWRRRPPSRARRR